MGPEDRQELERVSLMKIVSITDVSINITLPKEEAEMLLAIVMAFSRDVEVSRCGGFEFAEAFAKELKNKLGAN